MFAEVTSVTVNDRGYTHAIMHVPDGDSLLPSPSSWVIKINWGELKSMPCERERLPSQKAIFFTGINEMTNRISPPCPQWFMGASVSQSVSPRQELTDKAAVRRTYSLRAVPRTVKKTGSSEPTHQNPEGELVIVLSVCNVLCTHVQLSYSFHFISARVCYCSSLL